MQISFLLGPAGSGKTFRCLSEIRDELLRSPEGDALILIAPKQATFQLERQLLEGNGICGYSRLQILSFERVARFVFETVQRPLPQLVSDHGRTMVLRALVNSLEGDLATFGGSARRQGFATELAKQLREFTNHGLTPNALRDLAKKVPNRKLLAGKLHDFALLLERYRAWLAARTLQDGDALLGSAADLLGTGETLPLRIAGLWLDGFAQLTPEERRLLIALLGYTQKATLAFCLDAELTVRSPVSPWYLVGQAFAKCKVDIETTYSAAPKIERLARNVAQSRFAGSAELRHLESRWHEPSAVARTHSSDAVKIFECADPEAEATCCAREILQFVRSGGRFREAALLVRDFEGAYAEVLRRVFRRYEIPFFIDHRETVAHHPLAELTRGALRTVAYDWEQEDWFSVLKTGLTSVQPDELDQIENEALARGWKGAFWREKPSGPRNEPFARDFEQWQQRLMPPFLALRVRLLEKTTGPEIAEAIRQLWKALAVEEQLKKWASGSAEDAVHATVWEQMCAWLDDVERAFSEQPLSLRQWIPILESGLSALSVGVIPPVLDELLIGSVARSRNPDLKLVCVLGFNEKVFPSLPARETLLTEDDRSALLNVGSALADIPALRLAAEQFYGYIACTRARENLRVTYARAGVDGKALNPSRFISRLIEIFPDLKPLSWDYPQALKEVLHSCELPLVGYLPKNAVIGPDLHEQLAPETVQGLYGDTLGVPVSALERFASCPFRFFVERGLKVRERDEFDLDVREQGRFQHTVLQRFHEEVTRGGRKWRETSAKNARALIGRIADEEMTQFHDGLLLASQQNRFTGENYKVALQDFIEAVFGWFQTNAFDPALVEFAFGSDSGLPGWAVNLSNGKSIVIHGRVDRIDLFHTPEGEALCVIVDYKSGVQEPKRILTHYGIQQQLTAYLVAVTRVPEIAKRIGAKALKPAAAFLVPLRAQFEKLNSRADLDRDGATARAKAYTHYGLIDFGHLGKLDNQAGSGRPGQFRCSLTKTQQPNSNAFNVMSSDRFSTLLQRAETLIDDIGTRIFGGDISVHPFKGSGEVACKNCRMLPICRFDPWAQPYNRLSKP